MPSAKYSVTDARVCRALREVLGASYPLIARWTGVGVESVPYQCLHRQNVPADNDETRLALLRWWFTQRLPEQPHRTLDPRVELIQQFDDILQKAKELGDGN